MDCIFCKIIKGEAESSKIYEDDEILAFMDVFPVREGQVLVIPKQHIDHFSDLPDDLAVKIFIKAHQISKNIRLKLNPERMGLLVHGYGVAHAHMIILPQYHEDDITSAQMAEIQNNQIVFTMKNLPKVTRDDLDKMAAIIKEGLNN